MHKSFYTLITLGSAFAASTSSVLAGVALGQPLGTALSAPLGTALPTGASGLVGLAAAGVVAGVWLAKRKK